MPSNRRPLLSLLAVALMALSAPSVFAGTNSSTLASSVTLAGDCKIQAAPMAFGTVSGIASSAVAQSSVGVTCTPGTPYTISMNGGISQGAPTNNIAWRYMLSTTVINGSNWAMPYQLYQDSANSLAWGNTVGTNTVAGTGTGATQNFPVYGKLPGIAGLPVASYADTITVSVAY